MGRDRRLGLPERRLGANSSFGAFFRSLFVPTCVGGTDLDKDWTSWLKSISSGFVLSDLALSAIIHAVPTLAA